MLEGKILGAGLPPYFMTKSAVNSAVRFMANVLQ